VELVAGLVRNNLCTRLSEAVMFCSSCGNALAQGLAFCPNCGRPVAPVVPPVPGLQFQLESYAGKIKALSIVWFIYAGYSVLSGLAGVAVLNTIFSHHMGNWGNSPWANGSGPNWFMPALFQIVWVSVLIRTCLAIVTGYGLYQRARWGRIMAIVVAILSLIKFPIGTALGIWTMVALMGFQNSTLYEQLEQR
jgi:hypothetical protein